MLTSSIEVTTVMITPPSPIRETIDKTVGYVKKNGVSFEKKLKDSQSDGKFAFLDPDHKYHQYYKSQLEGENDTPAQTTQQGQLNQEEAPIKEPAQRHFLTDLPPLSAYDLDVLKLTALYVAVNTPKHADALYKSMERKGNRSQFAFMNKGHSLQLLFQIYVDQYKRIVKMMDSNSEESKEWTKSTDGDQQALFQRAYDRAVFEKKNKIEQVNRETDEKNRQLYYALIDWQDFELVSNAMFTAVDEVSELPAPVSRDDIVYRTLQAKSEGLELQKQAEEQQSQEKAENPEKQGNQNQNTPLEKHQAAPKGMKVRAAGESRLKRKKDTKSDTITCPITGKQIPESQFDNHLKTLLRDPRYQQQQDNYIKKNFGHASNLTSDQVYENVKRLVRKRNISEEEEEAKRIKQ